MIQNSSNRRYAIIGTGALGGYYGACLQQAGLEVHFLLRSDYDQVRQGGLAVDSIRGNFILPTVNAYNSVDQMPACDVVIVALKTTQNHLLPMLLPPVLKPTGVVVILQNGLGVEPEVADIVGDDRLIGGVALLCANKVAPGHIRHLDYGAIILAEYGRDHQPVPIGDRLRQIAQDFSLAGIEVRLSEDLLLTRWQKLVWNIPFNGLSVVLNAQTDQLMANPHTYQLAEDLMKEVVMGANACLNQASPALSRQVSSKHIADMLEHTVKMQPYRTSMKIDYDEGRSLEVETMFGNPLRSAQEAGVDLPKIAMLYQQLKFLDSSLHR